VAGEPEGKAHVVLSEAVARRFSRGADPVSTAPGIAYAHWNDYRRGRPDLIRRGATVRELASRLSMSPEVLEATVEDERRRGSDPTSPFGEGPYYGMGPLQCLFVTTEGGLRVDSTCRVVDSSGHPIDGLWAAGSTGQSGLVLEGHGLHILWAMVSGRISGRSAAAAPAA
jgi:fumarate reductase flavoprotein subunit